MAERSARSGAASPRDVGPRVLLVEEASSGVAESLLVGASLTPFVASTLGAARAALVKEEWDGFLVDLTLPDGSGLELLASIRERDRRAPAVVMTSGAADTWSEEVRMHGAVLVPKPFPSGWVDAFASWLAGRPRAPVADLSARFSALGLSTREVQVFVELATGATAEIAGMRLAISTATVHSHCARVYARLGVRSLVEVIALAHRWR